MPTVLVSSKNEVSEGDSHVKLFKEHGFDVKLVNDYDFSMGLASDHDVIDILQGVSATIAKGTRFPSQILNNLPDLRVIARAGVGFDRVDLDSATANDVVVTITPNANHEAVAEHAMSFIFALSKLLYDQSIRLGEWNNYIRRPIRGSTLGVVGLGRIGKSLAVRANAMKMKIVATEQFPDNAFIEKYGIELVSLDDLLKVSDYVSLHCPLSDDTHGMINSDKLKLMKDDASLVNTARGGLVVESDLADALKSGEIASAGLDVFEQEPTSQNNPLYQIDNVILSPHIAGSDYTSTHDMSMEAANSIIKLYQGVWPEGSVVNTKVKDGWSW